MYTLETWGSVKNWLVEDPKKVGNRNLNKSVVKRIVKNFMPECLGAITVNNTNGHVLDGQHRVSAIRELEKMGVWKDSDEIVLNRLDIKKKDEVMKIRDMNNSKLCPNKHHSPEDVVTVLSRNGDSEYRKLYNLANNLEPGCIFRKKGGAIHYRLLTTALLGKNSGSTIVNGNYTHPTFYSDEIYLGILNILNDHIQGDAYYNQKQNKEPYTSAFMHAVKEVFGSTTNKSMLRQLKSKVKKISHKSVGEITRMSKQEDLQNKYISLLK